MWGPPEIFYKSSMMVRDMWGYLPACCSSRCTFSKLPFSSLCLACFWGGEWFMRNSSISLQCVNNPTIAYFDALDLETLHKCCGAASILCSPWRSFMPFVGRAGPIWMFLHGSDIGCQTRGIHMGIHALSGKWAIASRSDFCCFRQCNALVASVVCSRLQQGIMSIHMTRRFYRPVVQNMPHCSSTCLPPRHCDCEGGSWLCHSCKVPSSFSVDRIQTFDGLFWRGKFSKWILSVCGSCASRDPLHVPLYYCCAPCTSFVCMRACMLCVCSYLQNHFSVCSAQTIVLLQELKFLASCDGSLACLNGELQVSLLSMCSWYFDTAVIIMHFHFCGTMARRNANPSPPS